MVKRTKIEADLDPSEMDLIVGVMAQHITKHREEAHLEHASGELTKVQLAWSLKHATWAASVFAKLIPGLKL